ncbi:MAG: Adenosine deaminase [Chloroflexi bacterium AL-W]|nr:Adenosine deaminase [Chloroflexi bacterium AL-N1]NOK68607.1 Adenosine deaminase [Chloroflexi bacterium AL-N10]NOK76093.1 Adenosine deaminase [Chloroflexi bacterium AL-N5]NOK82566.1 Adenosine deaminase [Chloroflexi bacterium AL-W]NOK93364.1 Adenosine deaminase [Chloroflexi bacterium AL-N15]
MPFPLPHFIEVWVWKNQFLREYADFTFIAEAVARDLARQNIRYAEIFCSPPDFVRHGLETQRLIEAISAGLVQVKETEIAIVVDLVRDFGPKQAATTLAEVYETREYGVVGVGIGGSEQREPPAQFKQVFHTARTMGFHTSAHAGEAAGAHSIWGAINALQVERIDHGTRAEEDEHLVEYLAAQCVPIEMCPLSNLPTGVVARIEDHPVRRYFERGLVVTINTDDPTMFGSSLAEEYALLEQQLGFSRDDIRTLILQGIQAAWLPDERKQELTNVFAHDPHWL